MDGPPLGRTSSSPFASSADDDDELYGTVMGTSRVVNVDVASWAKWKVISRNAARNACGSVADERSIDNLCATTGCVDTCTWAAAVGMLPASNASSSVFFSSMINDNVVLATQRCCWRSVMGASHREEMLGCLSSVDMVGEGQKMEKKDCDY